MKQLIRTLCIFLMGMSCWTCSDNNNAETDDNGKGAYALFLKKSITVSAGENQTEIVVEWAKTSWEITFEQGDIVKSITPMSGGSNDGEKQYTKIKVICNANTSMKQRTQTIHITDKANKQTVIY